MQRGEQDRREKIDRTDDEASGRVRGAQCFAHETEPVALRDLVLHFGGEHRGSVEEHDAPHLRRRRRVEEGERAESQAVDRIVAPGRRDDDRLRQIALDLFVDRGEEVFLRREVVVERAPGETRPLDDLLTTGARESPFAEQGPARGDEGGARLRPPLRLGSPTVIGSPAVTGVTLDDRPLLCHTCMQAAR